MAQWLKPLIALVGPRFSSQHLYGYSQPLVPSSVSTSGALVASKGTQYTYGTHNKHVGRTLIHTKIRLPPINVIVVF